MLDFMNAFGNVIQLITITKEKYSSKKTNKIIYNDRVKLYKQQALSTYQPLSNSTSIPNLTMAGDKIESVCS